MQQLELTPRLQIVANLVPKDIPLADIGTDHGYLPTWLIMQGKIPFGIAADLNQSPLNRAIETAQRYGVTKQMAFQCCDGLSKIDPTTIGTIAIAGMGGVTIASILQEATWLKEGKHTLILQPMSTQFELRTWLYANGYTISHEELVQEEEKLYVVMVVVAKQDKPLTLAELWVGRMECKEHTPLCFLYIRRTIERLTYALDGIRRSQLEENVEKGRALAEALRGLKQIEQEWTV